MSPTITNIITPYGLELVKHFEGCSLKAYLDPVGIPTIGYGTTHYENGKAVELGDEISQEDADRILLEQLHTHGAHFVDAWLYKQEFTDGQYNALASFIYNFGAGHFRNSEVYLDIISGRYVEAANNLIAHCTAGGEVLAGLLRRRKAERAMFLGEDWREFIV